MKRFFVPLLVSVFFLVPATSWSASPFDTGNLATRVAQLEAKVAILESQQIPGLADFVTIETVDGTPRIIFHDVNIQIVNGTGGTGIINGKGNLIIGYDEVKIVGDPICSNGQYKDESSCVYPNVWAVSHKSGSHNLVIGSFNNYSQAGGFVAGLGNSINSRAATICGGINNTASGVWSSVLGGAYNTASGGSSTVSGGLNNRASGEQSNVSGGNTNTAGSVESSVSGGALNIAIGPYSTVSGGYENTASGDYDHVP